MAFLHLARLMQKPGCFKKWSFLVPLAVLLWFSTLAQNQEQNPGKHDSLVQAALHYSRDSLGVNTLINTGLSFFDLRMADSALWYTQKAQQVAEELDWQLGKVRSLIEIAAIWKFKQDLAKSLQAYHEALRISEEHGFGYQEAVTLSQIGNIHFYQENYPKAFEYFTKGQVVARKAGALDFLLQCTNNKASIFMYTKRYAEAMPYLDSAYALARQLEDHYRQAMIKGNQGSIYIYQGNFEKGKEALEQALQIFKEHGDKNQLASAYGNLGTLYYKQYAHQPEEYSLADKTAQLQKAVEYISAAVLVHRKTRNWVSLAQWYKNLKIVYQEIPKLDSALYFQELYMNVRDSQFTVDREKEIANLEALREVELRNRQIEQLEHESQIQSIWRLVLSIGILLVLLLAVVSVFYFREKLKKTKLERENARITQEKLQEVLDLRNRQLTSYALQILQKNTVMEELRTSVKGLKKEVPEPVQHSLQKLSTQIAQAMQTHQDWDKFKMYFEEVHPSFFKNLLKLSADLTTNELRNAALVKLGMSLKESASILGIEPASVKIARNRLKKKLSLGADNDLTLFIRDLQ